MSIVNGIEKLLKDTIVSFSKTLEENEIGSSDKIVELWNSFSKMSVTPKKRVVVADKSAPQCTYIAVRGDKNQCSSKGTMDGKEGKLCSKHFKMEQAKKEVKTTPKKTKKSKKETTPSEDESEEEKETPILPEIIPEKKKKSISLAKAVLADGGEIKYEQETKFVYDLEKRAFYGKYENNELIPTLTDAEKEDCRSRGWKCRE